MTFNSPPILHSRLTGNAMNQDETGSQCHSDDALPVYTTKRPPTPPKLKQPSLLSRKQQRARMHNESNDYESRLPESLQFSIMNKPISSNSNCSKHTKNQHLYQSQAASERMKDSLQPPQPLPSPVLQNKPSRHLDEFFILQEQMDLTQRHRDQLVEENSLLKYHLHALQYQLQAMEALCYNYYCYTSRTSTHSQHLQRNQAFQYRPQMQSDHFTESPPPPPIVSHFIASLPSSHLGNNNQLALKQQKTDNRSLHKRFRRPRSKSLPRNTSFSSMPIDNSRDNDYFLPQPNFLFPPPTTTPSPPASTFLPVPPVHPHFQHIERSANVLPHLERHLPSNDSNNNNDMDDDGSESNSVNDRDNDSLSGSDVYSQQRRRSRQHQYNTAKNVVSSSMPSPPSLHQIENSNLSMGLPSSMTEISFGHSNDFYSANDEDNGDEGDNSHDGDNGWKHESALPRYYSSTGNMRQQQHQFDHSTNYPQHLFYYDDSLLY